MRIPNVLLTNIGCVFDAFLCVLADLSEHMHTVPDFFRRKSPEHIVCKLFLSADSVLNDFLGRILQMDFHMLPVLPVGFSGIEGGSDFVNTFWILRETFLRPEKKTSILTHIAVYERSGLGHRK